MDRRAFIGFCSAAGLGGTLLPGALWAQAVESNTDEITVEMIAAAEKIAGLSFTPEERDLLARGLKSLAENYAKLREIDLPNRVPPAFRFDPALPGMTFATESRPCVWTEGSAPGVPADLEQAAFWSVLDLGRAIRARKLSSTALTRMYLDRLKRFDPVLKCVITLTEERALAQARRADEEIAAGNYRGPLHGIPWGAKDLLAVKGYPTTWGAEPFRAQVIDEDATVVQRLDASGAVLVAKLTLGALAMGDQWYGGQTKNPWDPARGSSGSSAGPASATSAGLVAFAIGSETNGSIASPSTVCGVTGLRPTFGRISRHGAMALSWTMDKLGPICRTAEDTAIVLDAIRGADGKDPTARDLPFNFDAAADVSKLRVGYVREAFDAAQDSDGARRKVLEELRGIGIDPKPIDLPDVPYNQMGFVLTVEAAAAFDDLTRSNRDDELRMQTGTSWPNAFRRSRFVPAVEYIQANRVRTLLMERMAELMQTVDLYVTPATSDLYLTNFSGHPLLVLPTGFNDRGLPTSIGFVGRLYGEAELCAVGRAYQNATKHYLKHPELRV
jgi:Asp-tRNA(Asn)/Glu-tRNA(Gln) amidotransferase A subunit family amidase